MKSPPTKENTPKKSRKKVTIEEQYPLRIEELHLSFIDDDVAKDSTQHTKDLKHQDEGDEVNSQQENVISESDSQRDKDNEGTEQVDIENVTVTSSDTYIDVSLKTLTGHLEKLLSELSVEGEHHLLETSGPSANLDLSEAVDALQQSLEKEISSTRRQFVHSLFDSPTNPPRSYETHDFQEMFSPPPKYDSSVSPKAPHQSPIAAQPINIGGIAEKGRLKSPTYPSAEKFKVHHDWESS